MESAPGEGAVRLLKWQRTEEYYISLVDKAVAGFEGMDSNFESSLGKVLILHATEK